MMAAQIRTCPTISRLPKECQCSHSDKLLRFEPHKKKAGRRRRLIYNAVRAYVYMPPFTASTWPVM
jgi:hypothetical protein